jgi:hypothetical protein
MVTAPEASHTTGCPSLRMRAESLTVVPTGIVIVVKW